MMAADLSGPGPSHDKIAAELEKSGASPARIACAWQLRAALIAAELKAADLIATAMRFKRDDDYYALERESKEQIEDAVNRAAAALERAIRAELAAAKAGAP